MAEHYLRIQGPDDNGIYGKLRTEPKAKNTPGKKLIIHIHGMTHSMNHMLELYSADHFPQHGYDHYRIGLYDRQADSRMLATASLHDQVSDIAAVIEHFQQDYTDIYISAHSLGALAVLILNPQGIKAISLWDPAFDVTHFWGTAPYLTHMPERAQYQLNYGNVFVVGEDLVNQIKDYPDAACLKLASTIKTPTQMIIPELSIFLASPHTNPERYKNAFTSPFDLQHIEGANHQFSNEGNPQALLKTTQQWFDQH